MPRAVLLWDGDCRFCRRFAMRWQKLLADQVEFAPYQSRQAQYPQISAEQFQRTIHFIDEDGRVSRGAGAVFSCLSKLPQYRVWWLLYRKFFIFRWISELAYRVIAGNSKFFSKFF